ncbi:MAG: HEAT repeat domain-containing protein [Methanobacteriota archaeon]|nr:MAG: HEAT repeat domain-containing protein [Euryarchaeota archaeon]
MHKGGASAALGRFGDDRVGALLKVLESSDATRQATAAQQLGTLGASAAVPKLLTLLGAPENSVKAAAIDALSEIGDNAAIPHLRALLKTAPPEQTGNLYWRQDDEVRSRAVNALAKLGGVSVIPDLWRETLAGDRDAKSALIQMGDTAIPSLVDVLVKGDAGAQKVAAELISEIKAGGKRA